jgi:hypothetical protein
LRPASCFWLRLPPLPDPEDFCERLDPPLCELSPPFLDASGVLAIAAAHALLPQALVLLVVLDRRTVVFGHGEALPRRPPAQTWRG